MRSKVLWFLSIMIVGLLFLLPGFLGGCERFSWANYRRAVESGRTVIPAVKEMETLFPGQVQNFIGHNGGPISQPMTWNSEVLLYDRYVLTMQVMVKVNSSFSKVTAVIGEPQFSIWEVLDAERDSSRGGLWSSSIGNNFDFGPQQWSQVVANDGDFGAIGIDLIKDKPIENFQEMYQGVRRQREPPE